MTTFVLDITRLFSDPTFPTFSYFFFKPAACWLIFVTFTIAVMFSNFDFGRHQVPCYLSELMAFKCYFCHVFVMCSFNTWMKLSAGQLHFLQNLELLSIPISAPSAGRRISYPCTTQPAV